MYNISTNFYILSVFLKIRQIHLTFYINGGKLIVAYNNLGFIMIMVLANVPNAEIPLSILFFVSS